jgi:superfamily II DNA or RNA helicase
MFTRIKERSSRRTGAVRGKWPPACECVPAHLVVSFLGKENEVSIQLWPHQRAAIASIHTAREAGTSSGLWVMPTGTGKTVAFASLAKSLDWPTLVLVHRDELLRQAAATFREVWADAAVGTLSRGGWKESKVVVASVQSLANRLGQFKQGRFGLVVVDEAHHAPAFQWGEVIRHFSPRFLLGVTATQNRLDGKPLDGVFGGVVFEYGLADAICDGHIVPPRQRAIHTGVQLRVKLNKNDQASERALAQAAATEARALAVAGGYVGLGEGRPALFFAADLKAVEQITQALCGREVKAAAITGKMKSDERREALDAFREGHLQALVSCEVLTEGYDERRVGCVVMARPTESLALYTQSAGRGLRLDGDGKKDCLILDVIDLPSGVPTVSATALFGSRRVLDCEGGLVEEVAAREVARYQMEPLYPTAPQLRRWHDEEDTEWEVLPNLRRFNRPSGKTWPATKKQVRRLRDYGLAPARPLAQHEADYLRKYCEFLDQHYFTAPTPEQVSLLKALRVRLGGMTKREARRRINLEMWMRGRR